MKCPDCGEPLTIEVGPDIPPTISVVDAICVASENETIEISRVCWTCGWLEERCVRVESIDISPDDDKVAKRANLLAEITDELHTIEDLATLESIRTRVKQR